MLVIVHQKFPSGIGESLSGKPAFYLYAASASHWDDIENNPGFKSLSTTEQQEVKAKIPRAIKRHQAIFPPAFWA